MPKGIYINDSVHGLIRLTDYEKRIISSVGFNRLHDVYQNSTAYLTFPSNRTKRFEHSIGTMKLCSDMFYNSISNATAEDVMSFFMLADKELNDLISQINDNIGEYDSFLEAAPRNLNEVSSLEYHVMYETSLIPRTVPEKFDLHFSILMQGVRAAALLHDIGHPPFSHIVENALRLSYDIARKKDERIDSDYVKTMSKYFQNGESALHEIMGKQISESILREVLQSKKSECGNSNECLFAVLVLKSVLKMFNNETPMFAALHRIIDGTIDGDRLDYVTRDPQNSGFNSGSIDYSRIILDMKMIMIDNGLPQFCFSVKSVNAVDDFLKRRFGLYRNIIHHHRVIKTDYLLENIVKELILEHVKKQKRKSEGGQLIPFDISGLWHPLGTATPDQRAVELSQWNDSWLMTVLKNIYYTEYFFDDKKEPGSERFILETQMSELMRHKKCYDSLIKRSEDFLVIDNEIRRAIRDKYQIINTKLNELNEISSSIEKEKQDENEKQKMVSFDGTQAVILSLISDKRKSSPGFVFSLVERHVNHLKIKDFDTKIREIVRKKCKAYYGDNYRDAIVIKKSISSGIGSDLFFYDGRNQLHTLDEVSGIQSVLDSEARLMPGFYVYVLRVSNSVYNKNELFESIGNGIGEYIEKRIEKTIEDNIKKYQKCMRGDYKCAK